MPVGMSGMTTIGLHASHEQVHPTALLSAVRRAQDAGFGAAMCSDHFAPWSERQGHSGFAWSWLGAALATTDLPMGVVNAPGQRYHPAIIAQASATLAAMFPGRFWVALGSGENANEHITGDRWPDKPTRDARLRECVDVIRALHAGEEVTHHGLVTVDRARVWTLPEIPPLLIGPAVSVETARAHADWADGLITTNQPIEKLRALAGAYRDAGGQGDLALQVHLSWAPDEEAAMAIARDQWRTNTFAPPVCWDVDTPQAFDIIGEHVPDSQVRGTVLVGSDLGRLTDQIAELADVGFEQVYLHHVGQHLEGFVDAFGEHVLPQLSGVGVAA
ncbi:TIGR03885 family FMN-dependent LLM class oxidoreductase [Cellulomonas timonensis]|uniref:TIGR03885 family FMN-dependent LLM class oxidoreductase n=1 Tax=Cellulomonas timonensis TaxID=1689271 RepID=UPI0009EE7B02|nr:TIGR03885 family FMN-dependent LLM class oxidoreductase [Cellulomonas timonensis]